MLHNEEIAYRKGYRVRNDGVVLGVRGKPIVLSSSHDGRKFFRPVVAGKHFSVFAHRLQAFQKFGQTMFVVGVEVRHKDDNFENNSSDNMLIGTRSQNMMDKPVGERRRLALLAASRRRKLSFNEVSRLRADHKAGTAYRALVKKYRLAKSTISLIINNKTYRQPRARGGKAYTPVLETGAKA